MSQQKYSYGCILSQMCLQKYSKVCILSDVTTRILAYSLHHFQIYNKLFYKCKDAPPCKEVRYVVSHCGFERGYLSILLVHRLINT